MKSKNSFLLIHGFLGRGADWEDLIPQSSEHVLVDLFSSGIPPSFDFKDLARWINTQARSLPYPRILVGYSLGGRIALHALTEAPELWAGAVIVSANPGLSDPISRSERAQLDESWAKKFETMEWDQLLSEWNSSSVFKGGVKEPLRLEKDFCRAALAKALRLCSLSLQQDFRDPLKALSKDIVWVVGDRDQKFRAIAEELSMTHPQLRTIIIPNSGHRILFDQPEMLARLIREF